MTCSYQSCLSENIWWIISHIMCFMPLSLLNQGLLNCYRNKIFIFEIIHVLSRETHTQLVSDNLPSTCNLLFLTRKHRNTSLYSCNIFSAFNLTCLMVKIWWIKIQFASTNYLGYICVACMAGGRGQAFIPTLLLLFLLDNDLWGFFSSGGVMVLNTK